MIDIFPTVDVPAKVQEHWVLVAGFIPVPRKTLRCPQCRCDVPHLSHMGWHERKPSPTPGRCDVVFKCTRCSFHWVHGVPVPPGAVEAGRDMFGPLGRAEWREVRDILDYILTGAVVK